MKEINIALTFSPEFDLTFILEMGGWDHIGIIPMKLIKVNKPSFLIGILGFWFEDETL